MASGIYRRYGLSARVRPAPVDSRIVAWRGLVMLGKILLGALVFGLFMWWRAVGQ